MPDIGFLQPPDPSEDALKLFEGDLDELGFVMNVTKIWAYQPATLVGLFDLLGQANDVGLSFRERGIIVTACASALGDSYCSLSWGNKLAAKTADPDLVAGVLKGDDAALTEAERAMATWVRKLARAPHSTTETDVADLRRAGWTDRQVFAITAFTAIRIAFSTVNNALGAQPDNTFHATTPAPILEAVDYGRPIADN